MHPQALWTRARRQWRLAALLLVIAALAVLLTALAYRSELDALRTAEGENLASIAALKAGDLADMRQAQLDVAALVTGRPFFNANAAAWLANPTPEMAEQLRESLAVADGSGIYSNMALFDAQGRERLRLYPDRQLVRCASIDDLLARASSAATPQMSDLYRCTPGGPPQLVVAAPLLLNAGDATASIGTLLLAVDVPKALTPILGRWPVPSVSGAILLAERQGDAAVDLNGFAASNSPAPTSPGYTDRYPLTATDLSVVGAVLAPEGSPEDSMQGVDPQGTPVLAGFAAVPGTPWRVAAQMDLAEIDAPLASRFGWYAAVAAGLVGLGVALVTLLLQAHRQRTLRALYEEVREELKASEEMYHTLFNASPTPLSLSRLDNGRFSDVNQAFIDQFGYSRAELIGRTSVEVGLFSAAARAGAVGTPQGAKIEPREIGLHCKHGETRDCLAAADVLDLPGGRFLLISTLDITERKQAADALRLGEARMRAIIENTNNTIWSVDRECRLVVANAAFDRMAAVRFGRPLALGESVLPLAFPSTANTFWQVQYDRALRGESFVIELNFSATSGTVFECHMNPIRDPDGSVAGAAVLAIDITRQKQEAKILQDTNAELERRVAARTAELQETIAELHRANAGKDAFMSTVSHELRTPLTGILALSEVLQAPGRDPLTPRQARQVTMIQASGQRLLEAVNSVLLYTSLAGGKYTLQYGNCPLADICAESALALRDKAAAKGQHVDVDVAPPDLAICSDPSAIAKILNILLANAIKFTPQGGTVGVTGDTVAQGDEEMDAVCITVWDTGIGISPEQQAHLFDPFTQVDQSLARPFEGIGIGLASAFRLVALLGGRIDVQSEPGRGTRFTVTLPATPAQV